MSEKAYARACIAGLVAQVKIFVMGFASLFFLTPSPISIGRGNLLPLPILQGELPILQGEY